MQAARNWLATILILAAGVSPGKSQDKKPVPYNTPFFPLSVGNQWTYKMTVDHNSAQKKEKDNDIPSQKVVITVDEQEQYDYKYIQNKKEVVEPIIRFRLRITSQSKTLTEYVAVLKDGVYRFASAGKTITPPLRFLKLPPTNGERWTIDSISENTKLTGTFTCDDDAVKVPAGNFQAKRVSTKDFQVGDDTLSLDYWFAPNVGLVQQRVRLKNSDTLLQLEEFKMGK